LSIVAGRVGANTTAALVPAAVSGLEQKADEGGGSLLVCVVSIAPVLGSWIGSLSSPIEDSTNNADTGVLSSVVSLR
jgi:hypothetical protein